ncbi:hypothetical protein GTY81_12975 [Streptomyces sp. SID8366]|uniref:hypothetical protein n=1 Tax=unclassified Streptomyces TaxID=2593676 RepID=UPI000DBA1F43|nr:MULTISPECIES: hypothetical protein [unclassified Streptomyces]MYU04783.1 hypothetical protein [Streptomyces sp. SID8366]MYU63074.1 hypothetical protein [Streptomyces sp. SID69]RAJ58678.1 hypothetical protein K376_03494 [Streptomyces sp. PsTaAH-130]
MSRVKGKFVGAGLLAAAVVAGVGGTAVTVSGADRDPGRPVWKFPPAAVAQGTGGRGTTGLGGLLLPYEEGPTAYKRGPDIAGYGSDVELTGRQATALRKQSVQDLPPDTRRAMDELIDKQHIGGMAMRSYASVAGDNDGKDSFTVSVQLVRMDGGGAAHGLGGEFARTMASALHFREGPAIKGHKNAACFLTPKGDDGKFDLMFCSAYQGGVLVGVTAEGPRPLDTNALALFIGRQLDRIKDPGKAV